MAVARDLRLTLSPRTNRNHPTTTQHITHDLVKHDLLRLQLQHRTTERVAHTLLVTRLLPPVGVVLLVELGVVVAVQVHVHRERRRGVERVQVAAQQQQGLVLLHLTLGRRLHLSSARHAQCQQQAKAAWNQQHLLRLGLELKRLTLTPACFSYSCHTLAVRRDDEAVVEMQLMHDVVLQQR